MATKPYNGEARRLNKLPSDKSTATGDSVRVETELGDLCVAYFKEMVGISPRSRSAAIRFYIRHQLTVNGKLQA